MNELLYVSTVLDTLQFKKMVALYKDPEGETIFQETGGVSVHMERSLTGVNKVTILEKKVEELKTELAKYQVMLTKEHRFCFSILHEALFM